MILVLFGRAFLFLKHVLYNCNKDGVIYMLHFKDHTVGQLLMDGLFELERDGLRVSQDGYMSHEHIDIPHGSCTFCNNQFELKSGVFDSVQKARDQLYEYTRLVQKVLKEKDELLWPFSNPAYIKDSHDVILNGAYNHEEYLAMRYGRYKMALCGVRLHFSFGEKLLRADFACSNSNNFEDYKSRLYVHLAKQLSLHGWLLTALTAASPLCDRSFFQKGVLDGAVFSGMSSIRCSELGLWNYFTPRFDYLNLDHYVQSIENYVEKDLLQFPDELYFPVRLMPKGEHSFMALKENGVDNIELRIFDLNPYCAEGIDVRDVEFAHLYMVWLACIPSFYISHSDSIQLVQNFKNAAHYDLKTVFIRSSNQEMITMLECAVRLIEEVELFYQDAEEHILDVIRFEKEKCLDVKNRYAYQVLRDFSHNYVKKGLSLAKDNQNKILEVR